ncbi:response regulator [Gemmata sp.]|uniref:response regulator n=1 Tax=Gemmata sp. TaxID=1914242 RepID=UPI003F6E6CFD
MPESESILKVLCVDDNRDTADSLAVLLQIAGFEAIACYDGVSALEAAAKFHPDVCVLDLNMPGMNGDELGRRVRAGEGNADTTLVALTGLPEDEARERTAAAGFDLHLTKPVDPERLANTVIDIVILRAPSPSSRSSTRIVWPAARSTA